MEIALLASTEDPRSDAADKSAAWYESECRPGGPYGTLKPVPGGPYGTLTLDVRSDTADKSAVSYESECRPGGPFGALTLDVRSDTADESAVSYESECRPEGPYGALKLMVYGQFAGGPVEDRDDGLEVLVGHHDVEHPVHPRVLVEW